MEEKVKFNTAILANKKGFNYECSNIYPLKTFLCYETGHCEEFLKGISYKYCFLDDNYPIIKCPTQSLLQKWLREKYFIHIEVTNYYKDKWYWELKYCQQFELEDDKFKGAILKEKRDGSLGWDRLELPSYEEALEIGLQEALKLIPNEE